MNIPISEELPQRIERKVGSGNYPFAEAVMDKALELLDEQDDELRV